MFAALLWAIEPGAVLGQKVETQDAGAGRKQEFVRDASGRLIESRTIGANGKIDSLIVYEYRPGYSSPQQTATAYYADGKTVEKISKNGFDPNSNFILEEIANFDQSGRHVSGHKLTKDPLTGLFQCSNWDNAKQKYQSIECPAGEEAGGGPEPLRKISYEEAVRLLEAAQTNARAEQKSSRVGPKHMTVASDQGKDISLGIVLPAGLIAGEKVSGSVVNNSQDYEGRPDVVILPLKVPADLERQGPSLRDWQIEPPGGSPQPADGLFSFTVPAQPDPAFTLRLAGDSSVAVSVPLSGAKSKTASKAGQSYRTQQVCVKGDLCVIEGDFRAGATFVSLDQHPAAIVAQTNTTTYFRAGEDTEPGPHQLLLQQRGNLTVFPIVLLELVIEPPDREVQTGLDLSQTVSLEGADQLPDSDWRAGTFPQSSLARAQALVAGFRVPRESHKEREARERRERAKRGGDNKKEDEGDGVICVFLQNAAPQVAQWFSPREDLTVLTIHPESFSQGPYRYHLAMLGKTTGTVAFHAAVIPFLEAIPGTTFKVQQPAGGR